ncbi:serine/threonine-protein kinase [Actinocorallia sp. B10E7]|uniref:serine/threonine-protein kinase n=1 Tax=Actinocorallia sp. B10E7 TaxID=3153558 RepID=UPI00325F85ED
MRPLNASDPREVGPYRVVAELGRGGMGRVLLAAAPDGRLVAVKQVHARLVGEEGFRARFRREVAASRKVSGAFTAAVVDADAEAGSPWLASEFVPGPSLAAAVETAGPLPEESVRRLAAGLATALTEIHRTGLIHRDLKPANVLLAEDGPRVIDFGIARAAEGGDTELTRTGLVIGSPGFMSPEQADGRDLTPASDVFAFGAVLVAALTGRSPFVGSSVPQMLYNIVHAVPDLTAVPPGLRAVVEPCLAKDPAARPTPARILDILGPRPPRQRPWPAAVHQLIAAQRADIDRLLGDTDRTIVHAPVRAGSPAVPAGPAGTRLARTLLLPPGRHLAAVVTAVVVTAVVVAAGAAFLLWPGEDRNVSAGPADKYVKMVVCQEAAPRLPLPARDPEKDGYTEGSTEADTQCSWDSDSLAPDTLVTWELKRTLGGPNATLAQRATFMEGQADGTHESEPGIGDGAYWSAPNPFAEDFCRLYVLDANLMVSVTVGEADYSSRTCRPKAKKIAEAALAAMPR